MKIYLVAICIMISFISCSNQGVENPIDLSNHKLENFELQRYLGEWEEVARTDNKFEKGLTDVTAYYFMKGGNIRVINKGWNPKEHIWKEARGYIKTTDVLSKLEVSFFRPFYGDYNILYIDENYHYAVVGGSTSNYFWVLKRKAKNIKITQEQIDSFIKIGKKYGYETNKLIYNQ